MTSSCGGLTCIPAAVPGADWAGSLFVEEHLTHTVRHQNHNLMVAMATLLAFTHLHLEDLNKCLDMSFSNVFH